MIAARIATDLRFVLCGRCGQRLAHLEVAAAGGGSRIVAVWPLPGFTLEGELWKLGRHARKQWERDRRLAARGDAAAADRLRRGLAARPRRDPASRGLPVVPPEVPPILRQEMTDGQAREHADRLRALGIDPYVVRASAWAAANPDAAEAERAKRAWPAQRERAIACPSCRGHNALAGLEDALAGALGRFLLREPGQRG